ncbi:acetyl-CoA carboxylase biotin carboxyl carrier protein [Streptomyces niveiscabiei]|uniref:acetyl-CoA carboxylase biotin carboxyl carrier protein n=1 Tax=Streptomyces niveiscabiei TaxID=164115 RepID=UPI00099E9CA9|nr:biotin/lipoyl-containing protein [Streptomyces niveiscabiei]
MCAPRVRPVDPARARARGGEGHAPGEGSNRRSTWRAEPGAEPFVEVGDRVKAGQQVAIVEVMKLMIPVEADRDAVVVEVLAGDGESVEYGQALFALGPVG